MCYLLHCVYNIDFAIPFLQAVEYVISPYMCCNYLRYYSCGVVKWINF